MLYFIPLRHQLLRQRRILALRRLEPGIQLTPLRRQDRVQMRIPHARRRLHVRRHHFLTALPRSRLPPSRIGYQLFQTVQVLDHAALLEDRVELVPCEGRQPRDERAVHVLQGRRRAGRYGWEAGAEGLVANTAEGVGECGLVELDECRGARTWCACCGCWRGRGGGGFVGR